MVITIFFMIVLNAILFFLSPFISPLGNVCDFIFENTSGEK